MNRFFRISALLAGWVLFCNNIASGSANPESAVAESTVAELSEQKLNVLFLFADDMRADTIGAHGNSHIDTPHLDKLVHRGFSFRNNYVFGGNSGAVCIPSRAMLMTGRRWFDIDTGSLKGSILLPELLQNHGYETFGTGKWHNGEESWLRAFQKGRTVMFGGMSDHTKVPVKDLSENGQLSEKRVRDSFSSEMFADSVIDYLTHRDPKKPFFAYVAFTAPHDPRQPPESFRERYYRRLPPLPGNFLPQLPFDNGMMKGGRDENLAAWPRTEATIRDQLAEYYGLISHMDEQIGRILTALNESGEGHRTIVIFAADNGLAIGSHGLLGKQSVYEHSMKTPLVFAGPGIPAGGSSQAFTYLLDIFPTLCSLLQIPLPEQLAGKSLRPIWEEPSSEVRQAVFLPYIDIQRAVRDERWKLIVYPKIQYRELFDLQYDPLEQVNLANSEEYSRELERMTELLIESQKECGDTLSLPKEYRSPEPVDLSGMPRQPDQWQPAWIVEKYFQN